MSDALTIITGAAGFIGRNTVAELNARGNSDLLLVDALGTDEKWQNLLGLSFEDLIPPDELLKRIAANSLGKIDSIIHLGYSDDDRITPTLRPLNMYGYSKHLFDLWALKHCLFDRIVGLKYFNVFGPYEDHKGDMRSVVQKSFHQINSTGEVSLFKSYKEGYADGEQKRDFIYVKDAVAVTLHFAEDRSHSDLFNCGTGIARTWKDLATAVFTAMGKQPNIKMIEMPRQLQGKYQYFTQAEMTKLRAAGYTKPFLTLEEGVKDYVQNYLSKPGS